MNQPLPFLRMLGAELDKNFAKMLARAARVEPRKLTRYRYRPPKPFVLNELKKGLGYTGGEMAAWAHVSGANQWSKYTAGANSRELSFHVLFFMAARLVLRQEQMDRIFAMMKVMGGRLTPKESGDVEEPADDV